MGCGIWEYEEPGSLIANERIPAFSFLTKPYPSFTMQHVWLSHLLASTTTQLLRALVRTSLLGGLACWLLACTDHPLTSTPSFNQSKVQRAVDSVRLALEKDLQNSVPSLNVLIQTPTEKIWASSVPEGGFPVTEHTNFRFASNTKTFTATSILKMHQDGWLNYKARISDLIPGTKIPYVPNDWDFPYKNEITIEQLLQHTAGVYDVDNEPVPGFGGQSYTAYMQAADPRHQFTADELIYQLKLHKLSFFPPGTSYHYSNTGYTILGYIIAQVYSHKYGRTRTYEDYLSDYIVGPASPVFLNLRFPVWASDVVLPAPRMEGMERLPGKTILYGDYNMSAQVAEGNGYGSPASLNTFVRTLMKGQNVLSPATVKIMQTGHGNSFHPAYRLGTILFPNLGYGHNGERTGYLSLMAYDPLTDVSVVAYISLVDKTQGVNGDDSFRKCFQSIYDAAWGARAALGYPGRP